jgi:hypothetical protein
MVNSGNIINLHQSKSSAMKWKLHCMLKPQENVITQTDPSVCPLVFMLICVVFKTTAFWRRVFGPGAR